MSDLSVIIVNWNTRDLLLNCLESLRQHAAGLPLEVIVVDNASRDDSVAQVRARYPEARLIVNPDNRGFASANNQAIRSSAGRYVLLLNSDTRVHAGALQQLFEFANAHPLVGVVGPRLLNTDGSLQESWAQFPTLWSELLGRNLRVRRPFAANAFAVDWVGGACFLIRRSVIEQVGLMDEDFFMYTEETEWCYRVKRAGWQVCYLPSATVTHLGGQSSRQANLQMKIQLYRSKLLFFQKHYGALHAWAFGQLLQLAFGLKAALAAGGGRQPAGDALQVRHSILEQLRAHDQAPGG